MNLTRIFWEKATAAHVYCLQGEPGLSERFSRHFHDLTRLNEAGHLPEALAAEDVADAVHKAAFFAGKDLAGNRIDYMQAVHGDLTLVDGTAGEKLTGLALRLVLSDHIGIPHESQPDLLTEAEQVFAPKMPKAVKAKAEGSNKSKATAAKATAKKEATRKKAA